MEWKELYEEAKAYREDTVNYYRGMTDNEVKAFMTSLIKAIEESKLIK